MERGLFRRPHDAPKNRASNGAARNPRSAIFVLILVIIRIPPGEYQPLTHEGASLFVGAWPERDFPAGPADHSLLQRIKKGVRVECLLWQVDSPCPDRRGIDAAR